ncbi:hypothetical protein [Calothrix sp. 336/3]|uniref:hypothetical protein n=1 Tax=Calothrix sp. 336/3 TaxID=1337936 RepID=UPI0004E39E56|nr:hypothetical protein [Calothrix sp. 336/3]AKG22073.1 hypothetical protein IJ00_13135 [Calothrix sp. 336/3]
MEHWQFLIQKQGDRSWQPLETANLEISAGRYRVVARSSIYNTDVEVRVTYLSTLEVPPKRRIYKRSRRTSPEGLMAVIPYTYLQPGNWEIKCSGDLMSEMLGKSWSYSFQLQVLPPTQEGENTDSPQPDVALETDIPKPSEVVATRENSDSVAIVPSEGDANSDATEIDQPVHPVWLQGESAEQIIQNLVELALPDSQELLETPAEEEIPTTVPIYPLEVILPQETYMTSWGEQIHIHGQIYQNSQISAPEWQITANQTELRVELRSPETGEILIQETQVFHVAALPWEFTVAIAPPKESKSKLLLGEITLHHLDDSSGTSHPLSQKSFTVTANVTELVALSETISQQDLELYQSNSLSTTLAHPTPEISLDLELFNLVKTSKSGESLPVQPLPKNPIPPRIDPERFRQAKHSPGLQLPKLPGEKNQNVNQSVIASPESSSVLSSGNTLFPWLKRIPPTPQITPEIPPTDSTPENPNLEAELPTITKENPEVVSQNSELIATPTEEPYVSPLIRKWIQNQGYALAEPIDVEYEDYDYLLNNPTAAEIESDITSEVKQLPPVEHQASKSRSWLSQEIVVDDTPSPEVVANTPPTNEPSLTDLSSALSVSQYLDEPLGIPELSVPDGELIGGKSIRVSIRIPHPQPHIAVKFWVEDYQSRWILDGPRLLTDLLPHPQGGLHIITQVNIPLGSVEIRLEAIAIHLITQQESHKTTVIRTVVPPDLPSIPIDELLGI